MIEAFILFIAWSIFGMLHFIYTCHTGFYHNDVSLKHFAAFGPAVWMLFLIVVGGRALKDWMVSL